MQNNPTKRPVDPAKNEIRKISKSILVKSNISLCEKMKLNECKNTAHIIDWFEKIETISTNTRSQYST